VKWMLCPCGFICISQTISDVEYLFMILLNVYLLWKNGYLNPLPFLLFLIYRSFCILIINSYQTYDLSWFFPFLQLPFHFVDHVTWCRVLIFCLVNLLHFYLCFWWYIKKIVQ
jgi:hypothetical protein